VCIMQENDEVHIEEDHFAEMSLHERYFLARDTQAKSWQFTTALSMLNSQATDSSNCRCHCKKIYSGNRWESEKKKSDHSVWHQQGNVFWSSDIHRWHWSWRPESTFLVLALVALAGRTRACISKHFFHRILQVSMQVSDRLLESN